MHLKTKFNFIKIKILFLSHTSLIVSAQQPHVACGYRTRHHSSRKLAFKNSWPRANSGRCQTAWNPEQNRGTAVLNTEGCGLCSFSKHLLNPFCEHVIGLQRGHRWRDMSHALKVAVLQSGYVFKLASKS